jgi:aspartyl/glutamyl-tRNA(Asn/Gln) amidotransferase C subunit
MTETISIELFNHLVELAALELDSAQAEYLRRELNNQLKAIHELEAIPLDEDIPLTSHGVPYTPAISPILRMDLSATVGEQKDSLPGLILHQAPQAEDGYIIVPDIPHTTLK